VASYNSDEMIQKAEIMIAAGQQIDFMVASTYGQAAQFARSKILTPLDPLAQAQGIDLENEFNGMIPIDGHFYTISENISMWFVYLNKDMLDAAGLPLPPNDWTWSDYRDYAIKLTLSCTLIMTLTGKTADHGPIGGTAAAPAPLSGLWRPAPIRYS